MIEQTNHGVGETERTQLERARRSLGAGAFEAAAKCCRTVLASAPGHPEACFLLGVTMLRAGDPDGAVEQLQAALAARPLHLDSIAALGDAQAARGAHADAARCYARVLDRAPGATAVRARNAVALQQSGELQRAVGEYRIALAEMPDDPFLHYSLGTAHKQQHDFDQAVACYRRALDLAPQELRFAESLAFILMERRRPREAAAAFELALRLAPQRSDLWSGLCFSRMRGHDGAGAVEAARGFERTAGPGPGADEWLASALLAAGRFDDALVAADRALIRTPASTTALADKAIALAALGRSREALAVVDLDGFLDVTTPGVPDGYEDVAAFNAALEAQVRGHAVFAFDSSSISCHNGDTSGELLDATAGPLASLEEMLRGAATAYVSARAGATHSWFRARPRALDLSAWCTVLRRDGYQHGHIHPTAWLSGVYYLRLPPGVSAGGGQIEFGRTPEHYPAGEQGERRVVAPQPGTLVLFPSFVYHRTVPFSDDAERVTIAFDFRPAGNAAAAGPAR